MISFEEYENALKQRHGERIHNILSHSSVAIAGLGGLGSNIAMYLARAGVGHLHLVDFDKVDITNLNRQQYDIADLGTLKTDALTKNIKRFNPFIEITSQCVKVNEDNAAEIISFIDKNFGGSVLLIGGLSLGGQILLEMLSRRKDLCRFAMVEMS